ncbi:uncharacterized protein [Parasteatoda tepidariorum]|uniref:uncharacterized protein n=1 Tax=Parasteatoda tepidariorum TaxID=114398 RepID=UPI0039BC9371
MQQKQTCLFRLNYLKCYKFFFKNKCFLNNHCFHYREYEYDVKYEEAYMETNNVECGERVICNEEYISVRVFFRKFRLSRIVYLAKIEDIELFGYIGGYIGIWLGISFVSVWDLLEALLQLLYYACKLKNL